MKHPPKSKTLDPMLGTVILAVLGLVMVASSFVILIHHSH